MAGSFLPHLSPALFTGGYWLHQSCSDRWNFLPNERQSVPALRQVRLCLAHVTSSSSALGYPDTTIKAVHLGLVDLFRSTWWLSVTWWWSTSYCPVGKHPDKQGTEGDTSPTLWAGPIISYAAWLLCWERPGGSEKFRGLQESIRLSL
jgi:hypothetical protein